MTDSGRIIVRPAQGADADQIVALAQLLDHSVDEQGVGARLSELSEAGLPQLVAVEEGELVGLCGLNIMRVIHRDRPVGRITILVVREDRRGRGIGHRLLAAAEEYFDRLGCGLVEVTSNERLEAAHRFYRDAGYEPTSRRFAKGLA